MLDTGLEATQLVHASFYSVQIVILIESELSIFPNPQETTEPIGFYSVIPFKVMTMLVGVCNHKATFIIEYLASVRSFTLPFLFMTLRSDSLLGLICPPTLLTPGRGGRALRYFPDPAQPFRCVTLV